MVSRKGAVLVVGGSLLITLGSLVFAAIWVTSMLTSKGGFFMYVTLGPQTDQGPLAGWIKQNAVALSALAIVTGWLGTGGAFFLGLAALRPGLASLLRRQASASAELYWWLAILGLMGTLLAVLGQVTLALINQELGLPLPGGFLLLLVKMPLLWLGLIGFCGVLWGSFLRNKPTSGAVGQTP